MNLITRRAPREEKKLAWKEWGGEIKKRCGDEEEEEGDLGTGQGQFHYVIDLELKKEKWRRKKRKSLRRRVLFSAPLFSLSQPFLI